MKKLLIAIICILMMSCSNYYKAIVVPNRATADSIENLKQKNKYFILRDKDRAYAITNISFSTDHQVMYCVLEDLPGNHLTYVTKGRKNKMEYGSKNSEEDETPVLNEVHIYTVAADNITTGSNKINLDKIQKIEVNEKDKVKTQKDSIVITAILISIPLLAMAIAAIAIVSSMAFAIMNI